MQGLQLFEYTRRQVRVSMINDEPWFIAKDVCDILELGNSRQALSRLDDDEKDVILNDTLGGAQNMAIVSEAGLYSLIMSSRKPEAKAFKRWITHEVIPSIRKNGTYGFPPALAERMAQLESTVDRLNRHLDDLAIQPNGVRADIFMEGARRRKEIQERPTNCRNKVRNLSSIETQNAVPFVMKCLMEGMTYLRVADCAKQAGYQFSHQSVARFYQNIVVSKVENGRIYVVLKSGDTYVMDAETFEVISMTGKF